MLTCERVNRECVIGAERNKNDGSGVGGGDGDNDDDDGRGIIDATLLSKNTRLSVPKYENE